jgi:hypothetical protein
MTAGLACGARSLSVKQPPPTQGTGHPPGSLEAWQR